MALRLGCAHHGALSLSPPTRSPNGPSGHVTSGGGGSTGIALRLPAGAATTATGISYTSAPSSSPISANQSRAYTLPLNRVERLWPQGVAVRGYYHQTKVWHNDTPLPAGPTGNESVLLQPFNGFPPLTVANVKTENTQHERATQIGFHTFIF